MLALLSNLPLPQGETNINFYRQVHVGVELNYSGSLPGATPLYAGTKLGALRLTRLPMVFSHRVMLLWAIIDGTWSRRQERYTYRRRSAWLSGLADPLLRFGSTLRRAYGTLQTHRKPGHCPDRPSANVQILIRPRPHRHGLTRAEIPSMEYRNNNPVTASLMHIRDDGPL